MRGIPKWINSKQDVLNCVELALEGQLNKQEVKKKLEDLLSDDRVYMFKSVVNEEYTASKDERVCEVKKEGGAIEYHCYELQDNPNARYKQMGLSKEELQDLIKELE